VLIAVILYFLILFAITSISLLSLNLASVLRLFLVPLLLGFLFSTYALVFPVCVIEKISLDAFRRSRKLTYEYRFPIFAIFVLIYIGLALIYLIMNFVLITTMTNGLISPNIGGGNLFMGVQLIRGVIWSIFMTFSVTLSVNIYYRLIEIKEGGMGAGNAGCFRAFER